jgi:DNA modification methylase
MIKCTCGHEFEPVIQYKHKLLCGDCTDPVAVRRLMGGEQAGLCYTDPPYNVGKDYGASTNDSRSYEDYKAWSRAWFDLAKTVAPAVVFTPGAVNLWM